MYTSVNVATGDIMSPVLYGKLKNNEEAKVHPDSGEAFKGKIKGWDQIKSQILAIGDYYPELSYMGYDLAVTDDGFRILEINSLQDFINTNCLFGYEMPAEYIDFMSDVIEKVRQP